MNWTLSRDTFDVGAGLIREMVQGPSMGRWFGGMAAFEQ
jgi:hypothetical protein